MILSNKLYDGLKWATLVLIPALSVFYLALATTWGLPFPTEVAATLAAIDLFMAALLGVSTSNYKIRAAILDFNAAQQYGEPLNAWILSKPVYDVLSWVAQILLPAFAALYFTLAGTWGLPFADQVVATIMSLDVFLGMVLGFSTAQFHKQVAAEAVQTPAGLVRFDK